MEQDILLRCKGFIQAVVKQKKRTVIITWIVLLKVPSMLFFFLFVIEKKQKINLRKMLIGLFVNNNYPIFIKYIMHEKILIIHVY